MGEERKPNGTASDDKPTTDDHNAVPASKARPPIRPVGGSAPRVPTAPPPITPLRGSYHIPTFENAKARWSVWANVPQWKLYEGVALSLDIDPDSLRCGDHLRWSCRGRIEPAVWDDFNTRLTIATRNVERDGAFARTAYCANPDYRAVACSEFVAFALKLSWAVPEEFAALAPPEQAAELPPTVDDPRALKTFQKMILGMAMLKYGFDPKAGKSDAPSKIAAALQREGLGVGTDTVTKRLREAADALRDELQQAADKRPAK